MNTLRNGFEHQIISCYSNISWPACSPDLSSCDFFLWGYLKSKVFQTHPADFNNQKDRISEKMNVISSAISLHVMGSVMNREHQCNKLERNLKAVIFKK